MPFENGKVSFRVFSLPRPLPEDYIDRFAKHSAPPVDSSSTGGSSGWVTGRHMLDRDIREETAHYAGCLRMALLEIERKIPASLLKAECQMEELALMEAEGKQFLGRKERSEIKESVRDRLLPEMPPQLKDMPFIYQPGGNTLYASALSVNKCDLLCTRFVNTMGFNMTPCAPDRLIELHNHPDPRSWSPASFSPRIADEAMEVNPGREFLTWLLFVFDSRGGYVDLEKLGRVALMVEGPLTFYHEGSGAFETVLKAGEPIRSPEATTALLSGKQLKKAKLTVARNDEPWEFSVDGDEFVFRSVKIPDVEKDLDYVSRFQERVRRLDELRDIFFGLYDHYLNIRCNPEMWGREKKTIRDWVAGRAR